MLSRSILGRRVIAKILVALAAVALNLRKLCKDVDVRAWIVPGLAHEQQPVLVGLQFVLPRELQIGEIACGTAEQIADRVQDGQHADENAQDVTLVSQRRDVAALDVAHFVTEHGGNLIVGRGKVEQAHVDVNETECAFFSHDDAALFSARRNTASILTLAQLVDYPSVVPNVAGHHASSIAWYKLLSVFRI